MNAWKRASISYCLGTIFDPLSFECLGILKMPSAINDHLETNSDPTGSIPALFQLLQNTASTRAALERQLQMNTKVQHLFGDAAHLHCNPNPNQSRPPSTNNSIIYCFYLNIQPL